MAVECGCKWNNDLAHEIFEENSKKLGKDKALQLLRNDIQSWVRERDNRTFDWSLRVKDNQLVAESNDKSITGMIEDSMYGPHSDSVASNIKANAPLELETAQEVTNRAINGEDRIIFPEFFRTENGETVIRYFTVLTKDKNDPSLYHGSRIDLKNNFSFTSAIHKVGEKVVVPLQLMQKVKPEIIQPRYSSTHTLIQEAPHVAVNAVSRTVSEIRFTTKSVQRYLEKRKEKKGNKKTTSRERIKRTPAILRSFQIEKEKRAVKKSIARHEKKLMKHRYKREKLLRISRSREIPVAITIKKSITRHERRFAKVKMKKEKFVRIVKPPEKREIKAKRRKTEKAKPIRLKGEIFLLKRASRKEKRPKKVSKELKKKERIVRLLTLVKKLILLKEIIHTRVRNKVDKVSIKPKEKKKIIQEQILNFFVAYIFWLFLSERYHARPPARRVTKHDIKQDKKRMTKEKMPIKQYFWIIQAIIYHLVMIREQGHAKQQPKTKKVQKKRSIQPFAPQGVIFAYAT